MRKTLLTLAALAALCATSASAQLVISRSQSGAVGSTVTATDPSGNTGKVVLQAVTLADTSGNSGGQVQGNVASATADSGNPVKVACKYNATPPTFTDGNRADCQANAKGLIGIATMSGTLGATGSPLATGLQDLGGTVRPLAILPFGYNGATTDALTTIVGAATTGVGTAAVAMAPTSAAAGAIVPVVSTAVEATRVIKASGGNLYRVRVTTGASAGYLLVFNATTAPVDGAVTPIVCSVVAANTTLDVSFASLPTRFSTGISAAFSTTGCFTKTASATAMFEGYAQ